MSCYFENDSIIITFCTHVRPKNRIVQNGTTIYIYSNKTVLALLVIYLFDLHSMLSLAERMAKICVKYPLTHGLAGTSETRKVMVW